MYGPAYDRQYRAVKGLRTLGECHHTVSMILHKSFPDTNSVASTSWLLTLMHRKMQAPVSDPQPSAADARWSAGAARDLHACLYDDRDGLPATIESLIDGELPRRVRSCALQWSLRHAP